MAPRDARLSPFSRFRLALVVLLATVTSLAVAGPSAAQTEPGPAEPTFFELHPSNCPELTDSVYRLYTAYFDREPDDAGWDYWSTIYRQAGVNLASMSQAFAVSEEFVNTYGALSNGAFVDLVYGNVLRRLPEEAGRRHWVQALDDGYDRGSLMIAFSESQEYVSLTNTWSPMAGYLTWYDRSVQFNCGQYDTTFTGNPNPSTPYADIMVWNFSDQSTTWAPGLQTANGTLWAAPETLPPMTYTIWWNIPLAANGATGVLVDVDSNPNVWWTVAIYDEPHAEFRSPYTDYLEFGQLTVDAGATLAGRVATNNPWGLEATGSIASGPR